MRNDFASGQKREHFVALIMDPFCSGSSSDIETLFDCILIVRE